MLKGKMFIPLVLVLFVLAGCLKNAIQAPPPPLHSSDTTNNIRAVLAAGPLHIFYAALHKAGLDTALPAGQPFTVFAPTDSAFTAAGITMQSLSSISADSLARLIRYHIVQGLFADGNLQVSQGNVAAPSILTRLAFDSAHGYSSYRYYIFLDRKNRLYINGNPVNSGAVSTRASNGNIYSLDTVLIPPTQTVWDIVRSRPELSMYYQACLIDDSVNMSFGWPPSSTDSTFYSTVVYNDAQQPAPMTLLAPVNASFTASPFPTTTDLINYASQLDNTYFNSLLYAVVRGQLIGNAKSSQLGRGGFGLFYNDFQEIPNINNGSYNLNTPYNITGALPQYDINFNLNYFFVQFRSSGNTVGINWGNTFQHGPAHILPAGRNIAAINGVVHEVDSLFLLP